MKGSCVSASPPGISTPRKRGEGMGDMEICADTAVSQRTRHHNSSSWRAHRHTHTQANSHRFSHWYVFTNTSTAAPPLHHRIPRSLAIDSHRALTRPATHFQLFSESNQTNVVVVVYLGSGLKPLTQRRRRLNQASFSDSFL